jgi:hypothetical protein
VILCAKPASTQATLNNGGFTAYDGISVHAAKKRSPRTRAGVQHNDIWHKKGRQKQGDGIYPLLIDLPTDKFRDRVMASKYYLGKGVPQGNHDTVFQPELNTCSEQRFEFGCWKISGMQTTTTTTTTTSTTSTTTPAHQPQQPKPKQEDESQMKINISCRP